MRDDNNIPLKTNRVLNLFLLSLILIFIRVWFLSIVERDDFLKQSKQPRRRSSIEKTERGTIRDRYNTPLAENKISYQVAISYADIKEVPSFIWQKEEKGKKVKIFKRKEHIAELARLLAKELEMDAEGIEDIIYGKAALFPQMPFVIKEDLTEKQYYRLKMLEKDFLGIKTQLSYKRVYPLGKTASEIIGYMGSISEREYRRITQQIAELERYIEERENGGTPLLPIGFSDPTQVRKELHHLKERAYTLQDFVGKSGIESKCDKQLRGIYGKKLYEVDTKGNILRMLPGSKEASPARRIVLTISAELQAFAEELLAEREKERGQSFHQKGGAIVAMEPNTGEILALASYPRFNPEDFIPSFTLETKIEKNKAVAKWLETEAYLAEIWDGSRELEKELFDPKKGFYEITKPLTWNLYLSSIFSEKSSLFQAFTRITTLKDAWLIQDTFQKIEELLSYKEPKEVMGWLYPIDNTPPPEEASSEEFKILKKELDYYLLSIGNNTDRLLAIDTLRLLFSKESFQLEDFECFGAITLSDYNAHRQTIVTLMKELENASRHFFHKTLFKEWREKEFKSFLKRKREEEEEKGLYAKPYTDYLEIEERKQFSSFWKEYRYPLLYAFLIDDIVLSDELFPFNALIASLRQSARYQNKKEIVQRAFTSMENSEKFRYIQSMKSYADLKRPLLGKYHRLRSQGGKQLEKHLAQAFYPLSGHGYVRSNAFRQELPQGSIFKLVVAYEALKQRYLNQHYPLNPLTLIDDLSRMGENTASQILGRTLQGEPITRIYKGGKLPRSSHSNIGKVDLVGALEQSSNIYFALLAAEHIETPTDLLEASREFGYGKKTEIDLPGEIPGKLPEDVSYNKTGLYAYAIGQHSLVVTPLQTAVMLSAIANGGEVLKPQIIRFVAAKEKGEKKTPFDMDQSFAFEEDLALVGLHFPLFTESLPKSREPVFEALEKVVKTKVFSPKEIRDLLLYGMKEVVTGAKGTARPSSLRALCSSEKVYQDYANMKEMLVGKTGTAELLYKSTIDSETPARIQNHVWFTGISFETPHGKKERWDDPELVIVVYLPEGRYGGKEAAPLAAQMAKKYKEIKKKQNL